METNRLYLSCIIIFLTLFSFNINAAQLEGKLGFDLSSKGITVTPQVSALFENKFRYTARLDTPPRRYCLGRGSSESKRDKFC